jgi:hypothetical protein
MSAGTTLCNSHISNMIARKDGGMLEIPEKLNSGRSIGRGNFLRGGGAGGLRFGGFLFGPS